MVKTVLYHACCMIISFGSLFLSAEMTYAIDLLCCQYSKQILLSEVVFYAVIHIRAV